MTTLTRLDAALLAAADSSHEHWLSLDPAALLRWQHENAVAEMVNGLRWLADTDWYERPMGGVVVERHGSRSAKP